MNHSNGCFNKGELDTPIMPLIAQWVRQRPWLAAGIAGAAGGNCRSCWRYGGGSKRSWSTSVWRHLYQSKTQ